MVGTFTGVTAWGVTLEMLTLGALGVERLVARGVEMLTLGALGVERLVARGVEMLRLGALGVERLVVESLTALLEMLARAVSVAVTGARSTLLPTCLKPEETFEVLPFDTLG